MAALPADLIRPCDGLEGISSEEMAAVPMEAERTQKLDSAFNLARMVPERADFTNCSTGER